MEYDESETDQPKHKEKRKYSYLHRENRCTDISTMISRYIDISMRLTDNQLKLKNSCSLMKFFWPAHISFLRDHMNPVLSLSSEDRQRNLHEILGSYRRFHFDGNVVCTAFLIKAFRLSRYFQGNFRATIGSRDQICLPSVRREVRLTWANGDTSPRKDSIINFLYNLGENTWENDRQCRVKSPIISKRKRIQRFSSIIRRSVQWCTTEKDIIKYFLEAVWFQYLFQYQDQETGRSFQMYVILRALHSNKWCNF